MTGLTFDETYANSGEPASLDPVTANYYRTGVLPVEEFNKRIVRQPEAQDDEPSPLEHEGLFATHVREAIDILKGKRT